MSMTREVAYEIHTLKYMFGKSKPPKKQTWWPIEEKTKNIPDAAIEAFMAARKEYENKING